MITLRPALLLLLSSLGIWAFPQVCSINIGPDQYRCTGQTATFTGPAGYSNYLWSTGAVTQSITTGVANTYWCQVSYNSGNLTPFGNFSSGTGSFSTDWVQNANLQGEGTFNIGTNPNAYHPQFSGAPISGGNPFLIVNAGWGSYSSGLLDVWCATVDVCPGQTYTLSYQARSVSNSNPARLQWWVDGVAEGPEVTIPAQAAGWSAPVNEAWISGAGQTQATFCLRVMSGDGVGNDFGLDNVNISGNIVLRDYADLILWPLPVMNCGGPYASRCLNSPAFALNGSPAGGTWSGTGISGGNFDPAVAGVGVHNVVYSYTDGNGCPNSCNTNITVNALPTPTCGSYGPLCVSAAAINLNGANPAGGTWSGPGISGNSFDPAVAGVGVHMVTYSYTNGNGCSATCSTNITVNALPNVSCGSYGPACVSAAAIPLNNGSPVGGTWSGPGVSGSNFNPVTAGAGVHAVTYTYTDPNGCANSCSTNITVNALPVLNCGGPYAPLCVDAAAFPLNGTPIGGTWSGNGISGNNFDPATAGVGVHSLSYSYTDANGCANTCSVNFTVNALPAPSCGSYGPLCVSASTINLNGGSPSGGTWSGPGVSGGSFDPAVAGAGTHTVTYSYTNANGCTASCSTSIVVNALPNVSCGSYGPLCVSGAPINLSNGNPLGGTWSGPGVGGASFNPTTAGVGIHAVSYSYMDANGCTNTCTTNITVNALPTMNCGGPYAARCLNSIPFNLNGSPAGGSWSGNGVSGGIFDPAIAGVGLHNVIYTFTDGNGCTNTCNTNITVHPLPNVSCGSYGPVCINGPSISLNGAAPAGGAWSGPGVSGNSFVPSVAGVGIHAVTYTYTNGNGCTASCSTNISVNALPAPTCGSYGPACVNGASINLNGGSPMGGSWSGTGVSGSSFNPATAGVGTHAVTYSYTDPNGCANSCTTNIVVNALPVVDAGSYAAICAQDVPLAMAGTPSGGSWSGIGVVGNSFDPTITGQGSHAVVYTYTDANGCTSSDATSVVVNAAPIVDIGPDTTVCAGTPVTFSAFIPGATYLWSSGSMGTSLSVIDPGPVWVEVTVDGCSARDTAMLINVSQQSVDLGPDRTACAGTPVPLSVNTPGATYLWSSGSVLNTINATTTGWYWVDVSLSGCTVRDSVHVTIVPLPVVNLGLDRMVCPGGTVELNATTANASYLWNNNAVTPTITAGIGNWSVQVTVNGCSNTDQVNVGEWTAPSVDLGPDLILCPSETLLLDATTPLVSYEWQDASTAPTFLVDEPGVYDVTLTDSHQCTGTDAVTISYASPLPVFIGNDTTICQGTTLILDATNPNATLYSWNNGWNSPTLPVAGGGLYWVDVVQGDCMVTDSIHVTMAPLPTVNLGNDTTLCPGSTLLLDVSSSGDEFLWQDDSTDPTYLVTSAGIFSVAVTDQNSCSRTDAITVSYADPDALDLGADTTICTGTSLVLDATLPGSTYLWSTQATSATITISLPGEYGVEVTQAGCSVIDSIEVSVAPSPTVDLGNDTTLCAGQSLVLDASYPGATYSWSTSASSPTITVQDDGDYSVTVNLNGCTATDEINVIQVGALSLDLGNDTVLCPGSTLMLQASLSGGTTVWSTNVVGPSITVDEADIYWATIAVSGCSVTDSIQVSYVPLAELSFGPDVTVCDGITVDLDITQPGATYLWDDGSTDPTRSVEVSGEYWAHVHLGGCITTDTFTLSVTPLPSLELGPDTGVCAGGSVVLDATTPGATYLWSNSSNAATVIAGPGDWEVQVTVNGCTTTESIEVLALPTPVLDLPSDTTLCSGEVWLMDVSQPGGSYLWQDASTGGGFLVDQAGNYSVTVNIGSCPVSDATTVTYFDANSVDLGADTVLCPGQTLTVHLNIPGAVLTWPDGSHGTSFATNTSGTFEVIANAGGCIVSDEMILSYTQLPQADLGEDRELCEGDSTWLTVLPGAATIAWSIPSSNDSLLVSTSGTYNVTLSLDGCTSQDAVTVDFLPVVDSIDLGPDLTICLGQELHLDASVQRATYSWSTGSDDAVLLVTAPGVYIVELGGPCISAVDTVEVTEGNCAPLVHIPNSFTPDGDGLNELFGAVTYGTFLQFELSIYDRWGERIFTALDPSIPWDGTLNGQPVQVGVYVWQLSYKSVTDEGVVQQRTMGSVTLLR